MNKFFLTVAMAASLTPFVAQAATVDLTISGTIVPTSCTPSFSGGSNIDLGRIPFGTLSATEQNTRPVLFTNLTIICDAAAPVAISVTDNRGATKVPNLNFEDAANGDFYFGLGSTDGTGIGGFALYKEQPMADGELMLHLIRSGDSAPWQVASSGIIRNAPYSYSMGPTLSGGPVAARTHTYPLRVVGVIRPTTDLPPIRDEVPIDGSVTFELFYL